MLVIQTEQFKDWMYCLRDKQAKMQIYKRIARLQAGLAGDAKPVGEGVSELRIHFGPGYRVYFKQRGNEIIIVLCAGDKSSQPKDILHAKEIAANIKD